MAPYREMHTHFVLFNEIEIKKKKKKKEDIRKRKRKRNAPYLRV